MGERETETGSRQTGRDRQAQDRQGDGGRLRDRDMLKTDRETAQRERQTGRESWSKEVHSCQNVTNVSSIWISKK